MVYILKDMGTKSSDGYKVLIAIVFKICKAFYDIFGVFSKSNQKCKANPK